MERVTVVEWTVAHAHSILNRASARVCTLYADPTTVLLPPLTVRPPTGWCNFRLYFFPGFFFSTVFFYHRTPDSLYTSRHLRELNVQLHCAITSSVVHHCRRIRTGRVVCAAQRQQYVPVSIDAVPL